MPGMRWLFLRFVLLLVVVWADRTQETVGDDPVVVIDTSSPKAVKEAEFAVQELIKLSDSEVYTSLTLRKIVFAAEHDGIFHYNTLLTVRLACPFFESGQAEEEFKLIVMLHKEDGVKAVAIDEFPVMQEDAIEEFYIRKVERRRREREQAFRRLEVEAQLYDRSLSLDANNVKDSGSGDSGDSGMLGQTVGEALQALDSEARRQQRREESRGVQDRLAAQTQTGQGQGQGGSSGLLAEERQLAEYSLRELYEVVTQQRQASDFQQYRAKTLLDAAMASLP
ncbi:hypothetical protein B484DRAFT_454645 [Ochromonadaceae sp. CCMP2298]|nr:hypothetical protein B484DRAFT_454645 [Ochromonadaceae sp. CCMP2298]